MVIASRERVIGRIRDKKKEKTVKRNGYAKEGYLKFTITGLCSFYFSFLTTFKLSLRKKVESFKKEQKERRGNVTEIGKENEKKKLGKYPLVTFWQTSWKSKSSELSNKR